jgi:ATP-dependent Clp protease ATP-binding subunit ClpA
MNTSDPRIDEVHTLMTYTPQHHSGSAVLADSLKNALSDGSLTIIGATTGDEYTKYIAPDGPMSRRLPEVKLEQPDLERTTSMMRHMVHTKWDAEYGVGMPESCICLCVELSAKYLRLSRPASTTALIRGAYQTACMRAGTNGFSKRSVLQDLELVAADLVSFRHERNRHDPQIQGKLEKAELRQTMLLDRLEEMEQAEKQVEKDKEELASLEAKIERVEAKLARPEVAEHEVQRDLLIRNITDMVKRQQSLKGSLNQLITEDDVKLALERLNGVRLREPTPEEDRLAEEIGPRLKRSIFGQDQAIRAVEKAFLRDLEGDREGPIGALLCTGPPGTGKTALAEALAEHGFAGRRTKLCVIDATAYNGPGVGTELLGGRFTAGKLSKFVNTAKSGVILVDEAEKGDSHLHTLFLQMLARGSVVDKETGMELSVRRFFFIFTSNLGAKYVSHNRPSDPPTDREKILRTVRSHFSHDFLQRMDKIIIYEHLDKTALKRLIENEVASIKARYHRLHVELDFTDLAVDRCAGRLGENSGREAIRQLEGMVLDMIHEKFGNSILKLRGKRLRVDWSEGEVGSGEAGGSLCLIEEM